MPSDGPQDLQPRPRARHRAAARLVAVALLLAAFPASGAEAAPPLPGSQEVVRRLLERSGSAEESQERFLREYQHVRDRTRVERSVKGELRQRSEERKVHHPHPPAAEPDGDEPKRRAYEERDIGLTAELIARFEFQVLGRDSFDGRPMLRVAFQPRAGELPARKLVDRFINHVAGTLWLDEATGSIARAQLHLLEKVHFAGGIAGAVHSLEGVWERAATPEGVWYTRHNHWRVDYREFLVRKVVDVDEHCREVVKSEP